MYKSVYKTNTKVAWVAKGRCDTIIRTHRRPGVRLGIVGTPCGRWVGVCESVADNGILNVHYITPAGILNECDPEVVIQGDILWKYDLR